MNLSYDPLSASRLEENLATVPGWSIESGTLCRTFSFPTYKDGAMFAMAVAWQAEMLNHHPDILVSYSFVNVSLTTHDSSGLTSYDFELARRINGLT